MKLAYIYIKEHRLLENIHIPINSSHTCKFSEECFTLEVNKKKLDYYQGLTCSAIIGKNGVGKSTILDFIEAAYTGTDSSGIIVWFDNTTTKYHICPINFNLKSSIISKNNFIIENDLSNFVKRSNIKLVKANNLTGVEANDFLLRKKSNKFIYDMSLSQYVKGSRKVVSQRTNRLISYFNSSSSFNITEQPKVQFKFKFKSSSTAYLKSLLSVDDFKSKYKVSENEIQLLKHFLNQDLNKLNINTHNNFTSNLLRLNILSIFNHLSKTSLIAKSHRDHFFIHCLISFISNKFDHNRMLEILILLRDKKGVHRTDLISKADNLIIGKRYQNIIETLDRISMIQQHYIGSYKIDDNEVSSFNAEYILDLTSCISSLPTIISDNMPYGWTGFSTGEFAKLNIFSELYAYIHNKENKHTENHLIVMDEVDLYLHPDWQRKFLSELLDFIKKEFSNKNVQIILSTHSPIIISDFLPEDIVSLNKKDGKTEIVESFGFGSHITDLYIDGMHLTSTFGEHSRKAIAEIFHRKNSNSLTRQDVQLVMKIKSENIRQMILENHDKN